MSIIDGECLQASTVQRASRRAVPRWKASKLADLRLSSVRALVR